MDQRAKPERPLGWILIAAVAALVVVGIVAVRSWGGDVGPLAGGSAGDGFSTGLTRVARADRGVPVSLSGKTLDGDTLDTAAWRGEVVVVNVWGSWCGPCRKEAPDLARAYRATRNRSVQFLGIDVRDNVAAAKAFIEDYGVEYPSLFDSSNSLVLAFSGTIPVSAVPSTVVLDQEGRVAAAVVGPTDYSTLHGLVVDVLRERRAGSGRTGGGG